MKKNSIVFLFGSNLRAFLTTAITLLLIGIGLYIFIQNFEPGWKTEQRIVNQQIQQSTAPEATIILDYWRAKKTYIPSSVVATGGGDSIVLKGPKDEIVKIHRLAWDLD